MAVANQLALPPGASSEEVGRGRCGRVLFYSADRPRKKLITKLNDLFYVFTFNSMSNTPKTMELHFPCASRSSNLPSIQPSVVAASFWFVVAFKIVDRRPFNSLTPMDGHDRPLFNKLRARVVSQRILSTINV